MQATTISHAIINQTAEIKTGWLSSAKIHLEMSKM
jgi:hypothetical protein